ncbi:MAG: hypothetical protein GX283_03145 [Clostridiaceae bacterium]|nr:hypothetical protein [Clostridiaceae bacterium]
MVRFIARIASPIKINAITSAPAYKNESIAAMKRNIVIIINSMHTKHECFLHDPEQPDNRARTPATINPIVTKLNAKYVASK